MLLHHSSFLGYWNHTNIIFVHCDHRFGYNPNHQVHSSGLEKTGMLCRLQLFIFLQVGQRINNLHHELNKTPLPYVTYVILLITISVFLLWKFCGLGIFIRSPFQAISKKGQVFLNWKKYNKSDQQFILCIQHAVLEVIELFHPKGVFTKEIHEWL